MRESLITDSNRNIGNFDELLVHELVIKQHPKTNIIILKDSPIAVYSEQVIKIISYTMLIQLSISSGCDVDSSLDYIP